MKAIVFSLCSIGLVFGVFMMPSHAQNIFLSPNKNKSETQRPEVPSAPSETKNKTRSVVRPTAPQVSRTAPIVPQTARTQTQRAPAQRQAQVRVPSGAHRFNRDDLPCTKQDLKSYRQIMGAIDAAFSVDDDIINSQRKIAETASERESAGKRVSAFLMDRKNAEAFSGLLARCRQEIEAQER